MLRGAIVFAAVSVAGFGVWAFAGGWLAVHTGEAGLYLACALVFLVLSGLALHPLVQGAGSVGRFYKIFVPAFCAYAIAWCAAWFAFGFGLGEWLASLLGSTAFAAVAGWGFRCFRSFTKVSLVLFALHSAGYFLGGKTMGWSMGPGAGAMLAGIPKAELYTLGKLSWGLFYGAGFGAGLGFTFFTFQNPNPAPPRTPSQNVS
jgi:hypothetical protein